MACNCNDNLLVKVVRAEGVELPKYETEGAACVDLKAAISEPITIEPGQRVSIPTGLKMALPTGYELQVRPKSGLAIKHGVTVINTPGCVDEDFRGEVCVLLINQGSVAYTFNAGDKIAQACLAKVYKINWEEVTELDSTKRGENGFGSTGR